MLADIAGRYTAGGDIAGAGLSAAETEATALGLARELFDLAASLRDDAERARRHRLSGLLGDPAGQLLSVFLTDRVARDKTFEHAVGQLRFLLGELGTPRFMGPLEALQLTLASRAGALMPRSVGKLIAGRIQAEMQGLVFPLEGEFLRAYLRRAKEQGSSVNLNQLGEEVLGERQAEYRLRQYISLLERPEVETISVKLSSIFSQIDLFAWETSRARLSERLRQIYRAAAPEPGTAGKAGALLGKLVYLDMEAHRDLGFTVELVQRLLDEPEFMGLSAGLVLQAYIPESAALQRELTRWALARKERGGAPIRLRIVKGANLAAERVHSSRMGWTLPIYASKHEVDANYKRMLYWGTDPAHAAAVHLGIASHNLFDLALGLVLRAGRGVDSMVSFEVLEGMAPSVQRALVQLGAPVLVYAPAVAQGDMDTAVAYLIRRLDENTSPDNFLRHAFSMQPGDAAYREQAERFQRAHQSRDEVSAEPRRAPNRFEPVVDLDPHSPFQNEPDTDFSLLAHRREIERALADLARRPLFDVYPHIDAQRRSSADVEDGFDPSRPGLVPYRYQLAGRELLERAVSAALRALPAWAARSVEQRCERAFALAKLLRRNRIGLIAAMVLDAGKRVVEADAEVSEAIDFVEYYARQALELARDPAIAARPKGVVLVTSPWNFPLAIPLSGVIAALLGGNTVIFKPACETAWVGERLAHWLFEAGMGDALQFVLCRDTDGSTLLRHEGVAAVVLTGATSTARFFLDQRPALDLHAETGGKNALIVSALADRELAIKDLLASAFGYAGQKCSAAALGVLEAVVYDDPHFREQLRDAAQSLAVGSAWAPDSYVTPLIRPPEAALLRGLTELDEGETWLLEPRVSVDNPRLWSPGIKLGVRAGSFSHQTELFGPVLSVLRANDFEHAIALANGTPYGLTAGLHSLDEREQAKFIRKVRSGNLYLNRTITGAIVGRQPFGGHKASSVGPGAKAGGPNYVVQLQRLSDASAAAAPPARADLQRRIEPLLEWARGVLPAPEQRRLEQCAGNYCHWIERHFGRDEPAGNVLGQANVMRYQPAGPLLLAAAGASAVDVLCAAVAALVSGCSFELSLIASEREALTSAQLEELAAILRVAARRERADEVAAWLASSGFERLRWLGGAGESAPERLLRAAAQHGCYVSRDPVLEHGRYELAFFHREQSISLEYHRYGHLGWLSEGLSPPRELPALAASRG